MSFKKKFSGPDVLKLVQIVDGPHYNQFEILCKPHIMDSRKEKCLYKKYNLGNLTFREIGHFEEINISIFRKTFKCVETSEEYTLETQIDKNNKIEGQFLENKNTGVKNSVYPYIDIELVYKQHTPADFRKK